MIDNLFLGKVRVAMRAMLPDGRYIDLLGSVDSLQIETERTRYPVHSVHWFTRPFSIDIDAWVVVDRSDAPITWEQDKLPPDQKQIGSGHA
jgi:hypothetical protein